MQCGDFNDDGLLNYLDIVAPVSFGVHEVGKWGRKEGRKEARSGGVSFCATD